MKYKGFFLLGTILLFSVACSDNKEKSANSGAVSEVKISTTENGEETKTVAVVADDRGYIVRVGEKAPDFTLRTTTGESVKLSDMRGKVVMLQFTASWCGVCRKEMPHIEKDIWLKHKDNSNFRLLGIDRDEPLEKVIEFAKQTGVTYPLALDPNGDVFAQYADRKAGITRNVIIDKEGRIVMLTRLFNEEEFSEMCKKINTMLN